LQYLRAKRLSKRAFETNDGVTEAACEAWQKLTVNQWCRTEVVGILPDNDALVRLVGAILLEQNDEWDVQRARYMTLETMATL
jgi:hypothetical protein